MNMNQRWWQWQQHKRSFDSITTTVAVLDASAELISPCGKEIMMVNTLIMYQLKNLSNCLFMYEYQKVNLGANVETNIGSSYLQEVKTMFSLASLCNLRITFLLQIC